MIFNLTSSIQNNKPILRFDSAEEASEAFNLLESTYPYNNETCVGGAWDFHICCADGYENGIIFYCD